jgi:hypothetical protein
MLPEGEVPYTPNEAPEETEHTRLLHEYRKLYLFFKGGATISQSRRETLFVQLLEGLQKGEAEVLCLMKDKKLESVGRSPSSVWKKHTHRLSGVVAVE